VLPITIRSYETLIRLSTAHAKLHQSKEVEIKDCVEAFRLMIYCLYGDSHALDDKLKEIMKKINVSDGSVMVKNEDKKSTKSGTKKEGKKIED